MVEYGNEMDERCIPVCNILNSLSTVRTLASCSGHGYCDAYISFICNDFNVLKTLIRTVNNIRWAIPDDEYDGKKHLWLVKIDVSGRNYDDIHHSIRYQISWVKYEEELEKIDEEGAWKVLEKALYQAFCDSAGR